MRVSARLAGLATVRWGSLLACQVLPARYDDWYVTLVGEGLCPPCWSCHCQVRVSACSLGLACPVWWLGISVPFFLFAVRVNILMCCLHKHFPLSPFLSPFTRSVSMYFLALSGYAYTQVSPLLEKKALYHCNVLKIGRLCHILLETVHKCIKLVRIVQNVLKTGRKLSKNNHWIPLLLTPC